MLVDLADTTLDRFFLACAVDDDGVVLADFDALGLAQFFQGGFFQRQTDFFGDHGAAGQDCDVFQHGFATVAKTGSLDGNGLQDAADVVYNQRGQCFTVDVFCDDQQRTSGLGDLFQYREQVADVGNFFVMQQDVGVFHQSQLTVLVVDEVRGQVAAVELHAFHDVQFIFQTGAIFNRDHAFFADLFHG